MSRFARLAHPASVALLVLAASLAGCAGESTSSGGGEDSSGSDGQSLDVTLQSCKSDDDCATIAKPCEEASCSAEGFCVSTKVPDAEICDDGDPCTADTACNNGLCIGTNVCECQSDGDCAPKEDGNVCNGTLYCDTSGALPKCVPNPATIVKCDSSLDTACSKNLCDPKTGGCVMLNQPNGTECDDGEKCTGPDACKGGNCTGPSSCDCEKTEDCAAFDDGDPCNGTLFCELESHTCKQNPATVIVCPKGDASGCLTQKCDPTDAKCKVVPKVDGEDCDLDGSSCSVDACKSGVCTSGPLADPCGCTKDSDCSPFEDGDACNGTLFCSSISGKCEINPASVVTCYSGDDTPCVQNQCDVKTGQCKLGPVPDGLTCDDGWDCSQNETCQKGICTAGSNLCTCKETADCVKYAAQNKCAEFFCLKPEGLCKANPATLKVCAQQGDPACSITACEPKTGLCKVQPKNEGKPCEADGSFCTNVDICQGSVCKPASNKCPCQKDADCGAFEDGNACNGTLFCDIKSGVCEVNPATVPVCDGPGGGPCMPDQCDPKDGACKPLPLPDAATCDTDDFVCTVERCKDAKCELVGQGCLCWEDGDCAGFEDGNACNGTLYCDKAGAPPYCKVNPASVVTCPDPAPNACLGSTCDPKDGACVDAPINLGKACNDADACTENDVCAADGSCAGTAKAAASCDDKDPCTADSCDAGKGCVHTGAASGTPCDDGDVCTEGDTCDGAQLCTPGKAKVCDDGDPCTADACDPATGCKTAPAAKDTPCNDGDACATDDVCDGAGTCAPGKTKKTCDDGKPCTEDGCAAGNCTVANSAKGKLCDDGDACTINTTCDGSGACTGPQKDCDDNNVCTSDACVAGACKSTSVGQGAGCSDGDACTTEDACDGAGACKGAAVSCDDGNPCTTDSCDKGKGCNYGNATNGTACNDGNACTVDEACAAGSCAGGVQLVCADDDLCTVDTCDAKSGCKYTVQAGAICGGGTCGAKACEPVGGAPIGAVGGSVAFAAKGGKLVGWGYKADKLLPITGNDGEVFGPSQTVISSAQLVAVNDNRACAVAPGGSVQCFGKHGANNNQTFGPSAINGLPPVVWVSARGEQMAFVTLAGEIWLQDKTDGTKAAKSTPLQGGKPFRQVAVGVNFGVALRDDGTLWAWGENGVGQLAQGTGASDGAKPDSPLWISGATNVAQVCAGEEFACYRATDGKVYCWGYNDHHQASTGTAQAVTTPTLVAGTEKLPIAGGIPAAQLACGNAHACLVSTAGEVHCWGANDVGQLGTGHTKAVITVQKAVQSSGQPLDGTGGSLIAGGNASCIVRATTVDCWGDDSRGLVGLWKAGQATDPYKPAPVVTVGGGKLVGAKELVGSDGAFCARLLSDPKDVESDPAWYCWGRNSGGLVPGGDQNLQQATLLNAFNGAWSLSPGPNESCRDGVQGGTECWGSNTNGATLGVADGKAVTQFAQPKDLSWQSGARRSASHGCANGDGALYCWGQNSFGQIGNGKTSATEQPVEIPISNLGSFRVTQTLTCARIFDGTLKCWGNNGFGRVGDNTKVHRSTPTLVNGGNSLFMDFDASATHVCGVQADLDQQQDPVSNGKLACWGFNGGASLNVLGAGSTANELLVPTTTTYFGGSGQPLAKHVAVGTMTTCVTDSTDKLYCVSAPTPLAAWATAPMVRFLPRRSRSRRRCRRSTRTSDRLATPCALTQESRRTPTTARSGARGDRYGAQRPGVARTSPFAKSQNLP
ncbi:MAG: hypothetical protein H6747_12425 [Deltaproteobacteria bacterium]|nr:hypothetical protein [Deltaproteobacteria bacterium]